MDIKDIPMLNRLINVDTKEPLLLSTLLKNITPGVIFSSQVFVELTFVEIRDEGIIFQSSDNREIKLDNRGRLFPGGVCVVWPVYEDNWEKWAQRHWETIVDNISIPSYKSFKSTICSGDICPALKLDVVIMPTEIINAIGWKKSDNIEVKIIGDKIEITKL